MNFKYANYPTVANWVNFLTNGANIIGLLSAPEYMDGSGKPVPNFGSGIITNHVIAYVRSFSGLAAEQPPQDNSIMQGDAFSYRLLCVNAPTAVDTNMLVNPGYARQLAGNLHELRLTFMWPQLPNGNVGNFRQTFRVSVGGQMTNYFVGGQPLYFYQSQSFTNAP